MNCACWAIAEDPGPALWLAATKDELRDFLRERLTPTFETCRSVKERMGEPTLAGFAFDGMPFYAGWSGSKAQLQSKPIRWLFCDEVRNYPPGRLEMVLKRTRSFWNLRRFLSSTPGTKGNAMDTAFRVGDQRLRQFERHPPHFSSAVYESVFFDIRVANLYDEVVIGPIKQAGAADDPGTQRGLSGLTRKQGAVSEVLRAQLVSTVASLGATATRAELQNALTTNQTFV